MNENGAKPGEKSLASLTALVVLAVAMCAIYAVIAALSNRFQYDSPLRNRPIPLVLGLLGAATVLYLVASWIASRTKPTRALTLLIVVGACLFRCILIPSTPIQEVDIYRYLWDGAVTVAGVSPFRYAPARVLDPRDLTEHELHRLAQLRNEPAMATILSRVHFAELPTVYPPVSQAVFAAATWSTPNNAHLSSRRAIMKTWFIAFDIATLCILISLLHRVGMPVGLSVLYGWCPLVVKEVANSGHLDSVAVCLTMFAIYLLVAALQRSAQSGGSHPDRLGLLLGLASTLALALAVGAKLYPIVLMPMFLVLHGKYFGRIGFIAATSVSIVVTVLMLLPMYPGQQRAESHATRGVPNVAAAPIPPGAERESTIADPSLGLKTFLRSWEMNDFLFLIVVENLKPADSRADQTRPWFVIVPEGIRKRVVSRIALGKDAAAAEIAFILARALLTLLFLALMCVWVWRATRSSEPKQWLQYAFLTIAWFWLLCPTQNPWYWTWAMPLLPFARSRIWWLMSGLVMIYYLRFWLWYEFAETPLLGTPYHGPAFFDYVVTWLEFGPWFICLAASYALYRRSNRGRDACDRDSL